MSFDAVPFCIPFPLAYFLAKTHKSKIEEQEVLSLPNPDRGEKLEGEWYEGEITHHLHCFACRLLNLHLAVIRLFMDAKNGDPSNVQNIVPSGEIPQCYSV